MNVKAAAPSGVLVVPGLGVLSAWWPVAAWFVLNFTFSTSYFSANATGSVIKPILRFLLPHADPLTIDTLHALIRKLAHFTQYAVLFWLLARKPMRRRPALALGVCVILALTDEGHQMFVPSRTASLLDVGLDFSGALFANFVRAGIAAIS
jgi:VanZ family protein